MENNKKIWFKNRGTLFTSLGKAPVTWQGYFVDIAGAVFLLFFSINLFEEYTTNNFSFFVNLIGSVSTIVIVLFIAFKKS